ncbi:hypothetical protein AVL59_43390 [Streptomyces griseochromogenes]|uniref:Uncharacterized protein n=1 Tax=Streptomyces griseochromogenes TaxID=68214 RepID=A0A1B1B9M5_9ACTN|nr:hypothetical protein AVL59_43390 [Streptomyces griseochromogenes]
MAPGAPGGGKFCGPGAFEASSAGATAVGGSWLPPDINAVFASGVAAGGRGTSWPCSLNGGANTVAGSGTERSSPASAFVSVPAHGVAPAGTSGAPGTPGALCGPPEATAPCAPPGPAAGHEAPLPPAPPAVPAPPDPAGTPAAAAPEPALALALEAASSAAAGTPACVSASTPPPAKPPPTEPAPESAPAAAAAPESSPDRRSGRPSLSAASCNHSGGLSRNDV